MSEELKWLDDQQVRDELNIVETMFSAKGKMQLSKICAEAQKYVAAWELFKIKIQEEIDKACSQERIWHESYKDYEIKDMILDIEKRVGL